MTIPFGILKVERAAPKSLFWAMLLMLKPYQFAITHENIFNWWGPDRKPDPKWIPAARGNALTFNMPQ